MLIKINQAIKGAGSFTWHVLIPDEGDIRKHFYGSVKKRTSSGKSKKRRRENYDYSASWALLSKQIVGSYQQNFCDGNIFDKICSISTATAKKVSNAFLFLYSFIYWNGFILFLLMKILHFFIIIASFFTWGMNSKRELLHKQCLLETF